MNPANSCLDEWVDPDARRGTEDFGIFKLSRFGLSSRLRGSITRLERSREFVVGNERVRWLKVFVIALPVIARQARDGDSIGIQKVP